LLIFCQSKLTLWFADVALVTSLRDGMNLVSYEFVACQSMKKGVLILSEVNMYSNAHQKIDVLLYNFYKVLKIGVFCVFWMWQLAGAAQSLGAGAILVNPWNISDVAAAIKDALDMSEDVREECHRHNFDHVSLHTAQSWADTFVK
jgi:trehalose 6-phosphate synthase/phosphatase